MSGQDSHGSSRLLRRTTKDARKPNRGRTSKRSKKDVYLGVALGKVKGSEDATRRIRDGTADSISFGRGAREHDEREPVLSRLHCGHHARFIRTGSRCCVIGSKSTNTRLIRSLMSLVVAAKSTGCRWGRQCLFLTQKRHWAMAGAS
jgi:hypothetical protein